MCKLSSPRVHVSEAAWMDGGLICDSDTVPLNELFLEPTDWIVSRLVHRGFVGIRLGQVTFTDLDLADDVAIMAEMLEVLIL